MKPAPHSPSPPLPDAWEMLHALPQALLLADAHMQVQWVNEATEQLLGSSQRMLCSQPLARELADLTMKAFASGVISHAQQLALPRAGQPLLHVSATACPVFDGDTPHPKAVCLQLTPTAMHGAIGGGERAAAMSAMLAHEIRNPLSGIRGAAQLLEHSAPEAEKPLAALIRHETDRIAALLQRMEFLSGEPADCSDEVNIHEVLEQVRLSAKSGFATQVRIETRYDPSLPPVRGNKDLLVQLFMNLVKNAAEALQNKTEGVITLTTRYQFNHTLREERGNARSLPVCVSVSDNAGGINEQIRRQLFQPFATTKLNGSGLGLAICARIAADHNGRIEVESSDRGSQFHVRLRMCEET